MHKSFRHLSQVVCAAHIIDLTLGENTLFSENAIMTCMVVSSPNGCWSCSDIYLMSAVYSADKVITIRIIAMQ